MGLFKIRVYDVHKEYSFDENGKFILTAKEKELKNFHYYLEVDEIRIESFRSDAMIDGDGYPVEYTRVNLTNGDMLFAAMQVETFEKKYKEEYLPLFNGESKG